MATTPLSSRISARYGPRTTLMLVIAIGYTRGLGLLNAAWQTAIIAVVLGVGSELAFSSTPALITGAVDVSETGAANGLNNLMRSIGTSVSSAIAGMMLANSSVRTGSAEVPSMGGFRTVFVIAIAAALIGLAMAALLPAQRHARHAAAGSADDAPATAETIPEKVQPGAAEHRTTARS